MIEVDKNEVKIGIPKGEEDSEEALLIAELGVAVINVAKHLKKDREDVLTSLTIGVIVTKKLNEILDELKDGIGKEG